MDVHLPEHAAGIYSIWQIHLVSEREIVRRAVREHLFRVLNAPQVEFFAEPACKSRTFKHRLCILDVMHIEFRHCCVDMGVVKHHAGIDNRAEVLEAFELSDVAVLEHLSTAL